MTKTFEQFETNIELESLCFTLNEMWCKPTTLLKVTDLHECFSRFLNCKNGARPRKGSQIK